MKTLLTVFTLVFTLMFSSTSFADWTKVTEDVKRNIYNVDYERIKKVDKMYILLKILLYSDSVF